MKPNLISVDEQIFDLTNESESIEGFSFEEENVKVIHEGEMLDKIDNETVLEFLRCPETKVYIQKDEENEKSTKMVAHNFISNETIVIYNFGDHIVAMNEMLLKATQKRKELKSNPDAEIINHEMITQLNGLLLSRRLGEVGIGEYRDLDFFGDPVNVIIGLTDEDGSISLLEAWQPELGGDGKILKHMDKLINWVNSKDFREMDPYLRAAKFHSRFIKIHPFREGNGRTGRMILNYMLIISGLPLTNIRDTDCAEYYNGVTQGIVCNNHEPMIEIIKKNQLKYSRELYAAVMSYNKVRNNKSNTQAKQI